MKNRRREPGRRGGGGRVEGARTRGEEWAGWHERTEREIAERRRLDSWNEKTNRFRWWCDVFHSACTMCVCMCVSEGFSRGPRGAGGAPWWDLWVDSGEEQVPPHITRGLWRRWLNTAHKGWRCVCMIYVHNCEQAWFMDNRRVKTMCAEIHVCMCVKFFFFCTVSTEEPVYSLD